MSELCYVYDRTSGDERQGQDAKAQYEDTCQRAGRERSLGVVDGDYDEDVACDTPLDERPGLQKWFRRQKQAQWGLTLVTREVTRLWRGDPFTGYRLIAETFPRLTILDTPRWDRNNGEWVHDADADHLMRFIDLWSSWTEKRHATERTRLAMIAIKEGRRKTKTGRPPGRPTVPIDPAHLETVRPIQAKAGLMAAWRELLRLRGYDDVVDPEAKRKRYVSRESLGRALGLRSPAQNPIPPKTRTGQGKPTADLNRPIEGKGETP